MIRAAVLGADVGRSLSPAIHNAAFRALGIEGAYVAISVPAAKFKRIARALRADGYRYLNVTIPYKGKAAELGDRRGPEVRVSGAANTLLFPSPRGPIRAENTDGAGLIAALADLGVRIPAATIVIVGAGGAAAGAVEALTRAGAHLRIVARRSGSARALRIRLPAARRSRVSIAAWQGAALGEALDGADVLVSAVPAAAWADPDARRGLDALPRGAAILEMAYGATSPLASAHRPRNRYADGLGMLVHQAARAVELALGEKPPLAPLYAAARR